MVYKLRTFVSSGGIEIKNYDTVSQVMFYLILIYINILVGLVFELCFFHALLSTYFCVNLFSVCFLIKNIHLCFWGFLKLLFRMILARIGLLSLFIFIQFKKIVRLCLEPYYLFSTFLPFSLLLYSFSILILMSQVLFISIFHVS